MVILGGDWKQLMPVVMGATEHHQFLASVKNSELFSDFQTIRLRNNYRLAPGQQKYQRFLKRVGTGVINDINNMVQLPKSMCLEDENQLIDFVFPKQLLKDPLNNWQELADRAILSPLNSRTFVLNNTILVLLASITIFSNLI